MILSLVQTTLTSPFPSNTNTNTNPNHFQIPSPTSLLPKTFFLPGFEIHSTNDLKKLLVFNKRSNFSKFKNPIHSSLLETPLLWAGRLCIFYALLKAGLAGSQESPLVSDLERSGFDGESGDLGFSKLLESIQGKPAKGSADGSKFVSKWHPTTKGTLRRNYRVPSKSEGRRLLKAIASLLSDDDHFIDATSHKGCQIRRESAHGESVCCNNVRALFDELPTPHLLVEITPFPAGSLTEKDYTKAEKLERVLRSSPSV